MRGDGMRSLLGWSIASMAIAMGLFAVSIAPDAGPTDPTQAWRSGYFVSAQPGGTTR